MEVVLNMLKVYYGVDGVDVFKWIRCILLFLVLMLVVVEMLKFYFGCVVVVVSFGVEDECIYCFLYCGVCVSGRIDDEGLFWCWGLYLSSDIDDYVILWCWFC